MSKKHVRVGTFGSEATPGLVLTGYAALPHLALPSHVVREREEALEAAIAEAEARLSEERKRRLAVVAHERMVSQSRRQLDGLTERAKAGHGRTKAEQKEVGFLAGVALPTHEGFNRRDRRRYLKGRALLPSQALPVVDAAPKRGGKP